VADPDGWWVAAAGRRMVAAFAVPRQNRWSFTAPDHPWVMHEWALGPLYRWAAADPRFFSALSLLVGLGLIAFVFAGTGRRGGPVAPRLLATAFYAGLFGLASAFSRPTVAALLFAGAMALLATRRRFGWREGLFALLVQLAWTNGHGSFPLGCLLLGWSALAFTEDRPRRLMAAALAVLVTFLNPYGVALHELVVAYATGGGEGLGWARATLVEFQPLWRGGLRFVHPSELVGLGLLVALALRHLVRPGTTERREAAARSALALGLALLAALQARHSTLAGLVGTIVLAPAFADLLPARRAPRWRPALAIAFGPALLVGLAGLALGGGRPSPKTGGEGLPAIARRIPDGAAVFVPFHQAGRFVWLTDPRGVRVFYDSRNDCYPRSVAAEGWAAEHRGAIGPLRSRGTEWAIARTGTPLEQALADADDWAPVATEGTDRLFVRPSAERRR